MFVLVDNRSITFGCDLAVWEGNRVCQFCKFIFCIHFLCFSLGRQFITHFDYVFPQIFNAHHEFMQSVELSSAAFVDLASSLVSFVTLFQSLATFQPLLHLLFPNSAQVTLTHKLKIVELLGKFLHAISYLFHLTLHLDLSFM